MINKKVLGLLGICKKANKLISGTDACIEGIKKKNIKLVILSEEASDKTIKNFRFVCEQYDVPIHIIGVNIETMSKSIGKNNRAVIGIEEENIASQIQKLINGGDLNG